MTADEIVELLQSGKGRFTDGEPVDEHDHALQCAALAQAAGADAELVLAAALHDIGYHPLVATRFAGQPHEIAGARFAAELFGERVGWLIAQHVPAKRYLVAIDPHYANALSDASVRSLARQGGPMTAAEIRDFEHHPSAEAAAQLRRWDDLAKVPGARTLSTAELRHVIRLVAGRAGRCS
jgi:predicted HD phosphohydrolase